MRSRLAALTVAEKARQSDHLSAQVAALLPHGACVGTFAASAREPSLASLFERRPDLQLAFPRCLSGNAMVFHKVAHLSQLTPGAFGLLEPTPDLPEVPPSSLDAVLCPGVAFTKDGARLGHGGGFYDRYLSQIPRVPRYGIGFSCQLVPTLPCDVHDQKMTEVLCG